MVQCVDSWDIDVVWGDVIADNKKWLIRNDYPTSMKQGRCKIFECFCHSRCLFVFAGFSWRKKVLPWDSPSMLWVFTPFDFCYCEHSQKYWRRLIFVTVSTAKNTEDVWALLAFLWVLSSFDMTFVSKGNLNFEIFCWIIETYSE